MSVTQALVPLAKLEVMLLVAYTSAARVPLVTCDQEAPAICQAVLTAVDIESSQAAV